MRDTGKCFLQYHLFGLQNTMDSKKEKINKFVAKIGGTCVIA
jgi:hypothetical protein